MPTSRHLHLAVSGAQAHQRAEHRRHVVRTFQTCPDYRLTSVPAQPPQFQNSETKSMGEGAYYRRQTRFFLPSIGSPVKVRGFTSVENLL
jgi:hypothetical protein